MPTSSKAQTPKAQAQARRQRLLAMLAEGSFYSGEQLAKKLKISRAGVWKLMNSLKALGVDIESVARQGYRLPRAVDLLDKDAIVSSLPATTRSQLERADVLLTVDSTNRFVADLSPPQAGRFQLCTAEVQNAGRGRRGRSWIAPFGSGVCMSLGWQFVEAPPTFSALSLAVGVAVVKAFKRLGIAGVGLKWPNDLQWQGRKLGGILIEMRGESAGPAQVIIGIGINMQMPSAIRMQLAEREAALIADIHEIMREQTPTRNALIGAVATELLQMLQTFTVSGFAAFKDEWHELDTLANAPVKVISGSQTTMGFARGVEADGTLLVDVDGELRKFVSGEVSLRAVKS
ncbi:biotin--[acetyl-CoA-carboxylase] ligase [Peristeroidobacter soli]|jgi:BirA family biotin operon repressor/biotin-[acetyl-CoA-carboxylase] ligase|uniref:biotin--[acetyl-CoA-carboxylase] ligase n=1 Tax=Peristeroidobacter soli TaxID=2497877 RepID=UPI00101C56B4|nr:biotin--[acetyl-CoA-carboxylase] ligase [Peristeroidobacter soli]